MSIQTTLAQIDADIATGDYGKARDRLHGLIAAYPDDLSLRRRLGDVYWRLQYPAMAGRYWYLEESKTDDMCAACRAFEKVCGNKGLEILLALKYRGEIEGIRDTHAGAILLALQARAQEESRYTVVFGRTGSAKYTAAPPVHQAAKTPTASCFIISAIILMIVVLIAVGLITILGWLF